MNKKIQIVGAGPGDPKLITLKGLEAIKKADVILYDRLASRSLLKYRKKGCVVKFVGKAKDKHMLKQEEINALLLEYAKNKKHVVRLKGGDSFIFGRGFEEILFLAKHGFECEVVPGVSSFYAVPEICGIPLTHRGKASGFLVVTGHEDPKKNKSDVDWKHIAKFTGTIVILMGKSNFKQITRSLLNNGLRKSMPCAVIQKGFSKSQKVVCGNLENIEQESRNLSAPCIIVIGGVVALRQQSKPLKGKRFISTSSAHLNKDIKKDFKKVGAAIDCIPMIKITPNSDKKPLRDVINNIKSFDWLVFTSRHGVMFFLKKFNKLGGKKKDLKGKVACVGAGTAGEFLKEGITPDYMPKVFTTKSLACGLKEKGLKGKRVALLRTKLESDPLKEMLLKAGAAISECIVYHVKMAGHTKGAQKVFNQTPDGIIFFSPKAVDYFFKTIAKDIRNKLISKSDFYSIGPVTTDQLKSNGINRVFAPKVHTIRGVVDCCIRNS